MAFSLNRSSGQAGGRRRSTGQAFSEINVTPFVDVMLVLLVIFMVTAPLLTVSIPVDLPKTKGAPMNNQAEPLIVTVDASGKSYLQETELEGDSLIERLIAVTGSNPDAKIYVRGDQAIHYGRVMEIMGFIAAAGFNKVSLIAQLPTGPVRQGKKLQGLPGTVRPQSSALATPAGTAPQIAGSMPVVTTPQMTTRPTGSAQPLAPSVMPQMNSAPLQGPSVQTVIPAVAIPNGPKVIRSQ